MANGRWKIANCAARGGFCGRRLGEGKLEVALSWDMKRGGAGTGQGHGFFGWIYLDLVGFTLEGESENGAIVEGVGGFPPRTGLSWCI